MDEKKHKKAIEDAARGVYELYYGRNTWKAADNAAHSEARQAVRLVVSSFEKNGLTVAGSTAHKLAPSPMSSSQLLRPALRR